jgi:saccharopine dehydrogenase-like NADP-dependent oxidoreductase
MNLVKDKILIIGGYGNVGAVVSKILANKFPGKVIVAGRSKNNAQKLVKNLNIQASSIKVDLNTNYFEEINFKDIHTAILCIEFLENDNFILLCIEHQINYTELATSYEAYQRFGIYSKDIDNAGICLIPGVGLMPGLSGVFVKNAKLKLNIIHKVESFVLLGLGENHGLDAIRWMMEYANKTFSVKTENGEQYVSSFTHPLNERLLNENHSRKFYLFNFGDQHIIANSMEIGSAQTRLAFDSKFVTWLMGTMKKLGLLSKLSKTNPKRLKKWLTRFRVGSEKFAVQTHCYGQGENEITYLAEGISEAKATGVVTAYAVLHLYQPKTVVGIKRLEELIQFDDFVQFLKGNQINIKIKSNENYTFPITGE